MAPPSAHHSDPTVYRDDLTGNETGVVASEENHHRRQIVLGITEFPAQGTLSRMAASC